MRLVHFDDRVSTGIAQEAARRGTSGILLGRCGEERCVVEDFEPLLDDLGGLEESVEFFRGRPEDLDVLGFYREQSTADFSWTERDETIMRRFFPESGSLLLLAKPVMGHLVIAEFFELVEGRLRPAADPFRLEGESEVELFAPDSAEASETAGPVVDARPTLPPATRPRRLESEETRERPDRSWWWVAAIVVLTMVGALLGVRSVRQEEPRLSRPPTPAAKPAPPVERGSVDPGPAERGPAIEAPAPDPLPLVSPAMERGVQAAVEQWRRAIRSGDPDLLASCYARSTRSPIRHAALRTMTHYGKPSILRVSGLSIAPVSQTRAVATFRKHWQTSGPKVFAGEAEERMSFVRVGDIWKISSEDEVKVYWTQRPR